MVHVLHSYFFLFFFSTKEICILTVFGLFQALSVVGAGGTNTGGKNESGFPSPWRFSLILITFGCPDYLRSCIIKLSKY